jgi:hypothetical protein
VEQFQGLAQLYLFSKMLAGGIPVIGIATATDSF